MREAVRSKIKKTCLPFPTCNARIQKILSGGGGS